MGIHTQVGVIGSAVFAPRVRSGLCHTRLAALVRACAALAQAAPRQ